jgi:hypothetical protein
MKRDPIAEWRRALGRRNWRAVALALPVSAPPAPTVSPHSAPPDLRTTRAITSESLRRRFDWRSDVGEAIRVLQRHNKRLGERFGIGWVDATNIVVGESQRRALPASVMARAIVSRLQPASGGAA